MPAQPDTSSGLVRAARFPRLRALAWHGDLLYASRGYELLRARIQNPLAVTWQGVATFRPSLRRCISAMNRLTARLFREGLHALAVLPSGAFVAAVPGAMITLRPNDAEFHTTHSIARGTRPLHIAAVPDGAIYWGEYFDNPDRDEVHIYASTDGGESWSVAYTFSRRAIRHVHNIVHDPHQNCLWISTGDYGDECQILRAACDFSRVDVVLQGNQQARAVALVPMPNGLYFSSDTPLEANFIYCLDHDGCLKQLAPISSSSIYGCRVQQRVFFSTMVEPSEINRDPHVRIFASGNSTSGQSASARVGSTTLDAQSSQHPLAWNPLLAWKKDRWPMRLFQYGNAFLPDGQNSTPFLAVSTVAVENDDLDMSLYDVST